MNKVRNFAADAIVAIVVFLIAFWLLRRVIGLIIGLASVIAVVVAVAFLLGVARRIRGGKRIPRI